MFALNKVCQRGLSPYQQSALSKQTTLKLGLADLISNLHNVIDKKIKLCKTVQIDTKEIRLIAKIIEHTINSC